MTERPGSPAGSYAVKTSIPINLIGVFKSAVTAESPSFTASGSGSGSLSLSRSFVPGGLLTLTPQFVYTAYLVDKTTNTKQKAITETIEAEAPFANKTGGVSLVAGHTYDIQIEADASSTLASVGLLGGEAIGRFDNVVVTGPGAEETPPNNTNPPNGNPGGNGGNGEGGEDISKANGGAGGGVSSARLESLIKSSLVGPATLKGNRLSVKATCPKKIGATCNLAVQGMLTRKKVASTQRRDKVKSGKSRMFVLKVKPAAKAKVKTKSKLLFKETVKVGKSKATVYKTLKLVRK